MAALRVMQVPLTVSGPHGVNAFLVLGAQPVIVDTGIPGSASQVLDVLQRESIDPREVGLIVVTHAHVDHAGAAWELKCATGAPLAVQVFDAPAVSAGISAPVRGRTPEAQHLLDLMEQRVGTGQPPFHSVEPDILIEDEYPLAAFGLAGRLIHTPGHTEGGLAMLLNDGQAIVGDIIGGDMGDPNVAALGMFAVDGNAMTDSVGRVLASNPEVVYCGHAGPFRGQQLSQLRESTVRAESAGA